MPLAILGASWAVNKTFHGMGKIEYAKPTSRMEDNEEKEKWDHYTL